MSITVASDIFVRSKVHQTDKLRFYNKQANNKLLLFYRNVHMIADMHDNWKLYVYPRN